MLADEADTNGLSNETSLLRRDLQDAPQSKRVVMNQPMALAQIITLMLQSPTHRHYSLSDLEWMVLPPLKLGQVAMAETKPDQSGSRQPLAVMFWATVSTEVDRRISSNLSAPIRLRPDEWRSGDILWIADMIGDMSAGHALVKNVLDTTLAGRTLQGTFAGQRWEADFIGGRSFFNICGRNIRADDMRPIRAVLHRNGLRILRYDWLFGSLSRGQRGKLQFGQPLTGIRRRKSRARPKIK